MFDVGIVWVGLGFFVKTHLDKIYKQGTGHFSVSMIPWLDLNYFPQADMLRERVYLHVLGPLSV